MVRDLVSIWSILFGVLIFKLTRVEVGWYTYICAVLGMMGYEVI